MSQPLFDFEDVYPDPIEIRVLKAPSADPAIMHGGIYGEELIGRELADKVCHLFAVEMGRRDEAWRQKKAELDLACNVDTPFNDCEEVLAKLFERVSEAFRNSNSMPWFHRHSLTLEIENLPLSGLMWIPGKVLGLECELRTLPDSFYAAGKWHMPEELSKINNMGGFLGRSITAERYYADALKALATVAISLKGAGASPETLRNLIPLGACIHAEWEVSLADLAGWRRFIPAHVKTPLLEALRKRDELFTLLLG